MQSRVSVSVTIPAYNASPWIAATLESFARQTFNDFEVIVADDGSSDNTAEIAETFRDRLNIQVIRCKRSGAPARPSNIALAAASGRLVVPCDADDLAAANRIQRCMETWQDLQEMDCLMFSDFSEISASGEIGVPSVLAEFPRLNELIAQCDSKPYTVSSLESGIWALLNGCFMRPCTVAAPLSAIRSIGGFNEDLRNGQDYDLYLRLARKFPLVRIFEVLGQYRRSDGNISSRPAASVAPSRIAVLKTQLESSPDEIQRRFVAGKIAQNYADLAYDLGSQGRVLESIRAYMESLSYKGSISPFRGMAASLAKFILLRTTNRLSGQRRHE